MKLGKIGIIGLGKMGMAIGRSLKGSSLMGYDIRPAAKRAASRSGITPAKDSLELVSKSNIVILAIKPQEMKEVLVNIKDAVTARHLFVSIAAGISTRFIEKAAGEARVVRVMPNIALIAGRGAAAVCRGKRASRKDEFIVKEIFRRSGKVFSVAEKHINAVTALSGSGPAYFFEMIGHLIRSACDLGLDKQTCKNLAIQTAKGAVALLETTGKEPAELRDMVSSKKGTTAEALKVLKKYRLGSILDKAVKAAWKRAGQLSTA
ncbi:pyrroline-5-carboxylate reductase [Candidatus Desantisbacteria bacterium CG_4_10_14_0_8_um_filter_48_22]|uniref:Pyrroline-5-carboxylate reductase n=1 Tax=Candidatus Desantisbacteria bacterium CG_4_10_14_0_8_um_filter_48_22 TaxID=1974543 RepID=A0A2M7S9P6_9BACT|nr:MAG: pyrroline-5-carboxylate reductase [Candidatus Desantisbacteria bacterium CG1_02_49_89]PIV54266.1 MAG: pyrroline-5-carboxylate reductase [Candidatus Desantisbacteria bacterium CG02_land_8_20_14_3_00_49_13]PIZ16275.1 MAG: pyrroline-5-carboxylate reductase [Candidatus Desantisbacteria bacterium CG_4_10_14_0_8_um_filter_48_22]PJB28408.1 MAG: pyrroline-5-carboxylate reductase [Candidatus Desantisbacteria bacterium CG_4_9_14_3_um_filter_50_7]